MVAKKVEKTDKKTETNIEKKEKKIKAVLRSENISSNTKEAINLYGKSRFGELVEGKIQYSLVEAVYLVEQKRMDVYEKNKKITEKKFLEKIHDIDSKIDVKYIVFKDLRKRGYTVKTALKFGAEFRVYDKGKQPGEEHAKWVLYPVKESEIMTWHDFSAKNRVAHSTRKKLLIAIVDEENDVTYYEVAWTRP